MADIIASYTDAKIIDLKSKNISYFDYEHKNMDDDFIPTMLEILEYDN